MKDLDQALVAYDEATTRYHNLAPGLEAQAERSAVLMLAAAALAFAPDATHMLIESSDQGNYMCAPHDLERDGVKLLDTTDRAQQWDQEVDQYDLHGAASWLTWGHAAWERFIDHDHPYTRVTAGYVALDLRKIGATL